MDETGLPPIGGFTELDKDFPVYVQANVKVEFFALDAERDEWKYKARAEKDLNVFCTECSTTQCRAQTY